MVETFNYEEIQSLAHIEDMGEFDLAEEEKERVFYEVLMKKVADQKKKDKAPADASNRATQSTQAKAVPAEQPSASAPTKPPPSQVARAIETG